MPIHESNIHRTKAYLYLSAQKRFPLNVADGRTFLIIELLCYWKYVTYANITFLSSKFIGGGDLSNEETKHGKGPVVLLADHNSNSVSTP